MKIACIVNYNTPHLVEAAIMSLQRCTPYCKVVVFDNSDREKPLGAIGTDIGKGLEGVLVLDNSKGCFIDFDRWLRGFPRKQKVSHYGSAIHCYSVQWLINFLAEPFVLMDSDVLVKKDITPLWDESQAWVGTSREVKTRYGRKMRARPELCFVNSPMLLESGATYFNPARMYSLCETRQANAYDTGCWFHEDCDAKHLPHREVDIDDYMIHLRHGSWSGMEDGQAWLEAHGDLWKPTMGGAEGVNKNI